MRRYRRLIFTVCLLTYVVTFPMIYDKVGKLFSVACDNSISGCSKLWSEPSQDPRVTFYTLHYIVNKIKYQNASDFSKRIEIKFEKLPAPTVGECTNYSFFSQIKLDPQWWESSSYQEKLELVYHEMGHCDLNYGHVPKGIMDPWPTNIFYLKDMDATLRTFFNQDSMLKASEYTDCER